MVVSRGARSLLSSRLGRKSPCLHTSTSTAAQRTPSIVFTYLRAVGSGLFYGMVTKLSVRLGVVTAAAAAVAVAAIYFGTLISWTYVGEHAPCVPGRQRHEVRMHLEI